MCTTARNNFAFPITGSTLKWEQKENTGILLESAHLNDLSELDSILEVQVKSPNFPPPWKKKKGKKGTW